MTIIAETSHSHEGIFSEANGTRSRENIIVESGQDLPAMMVLGLVTATSKYAEYNGGLADGTETAVGVLLSAVDASAADVVGVAILRDAEIKLSALQWESGATQQEKDDAVADMLALGIIIRDGV